MLVNSRARVTIPNNARLCRDVDYHPYYLLKTNPQLIEPGAGREMGIIRSSFAFKKIIINIGAQYSDTGVHHLFHREALFTVFSADSTVG